MNETPKIPPPTRQAKPVRKPLELADWDSETYTEANEQLMLRLGKKPDGFDVQWVIDSVLGQPQAAARAAFERQGWKPVWGSDFGGMYDGIFSSPGTEGEINFGGLVLMCRPMSWSIRSREAERRSATEQVRGNEDKVRTGNLDGVTLAADHKSALAFNHVNRSVQVIQVPQDNGKK